jgi:N-acetylglucosamine-6-sulfatase
MKKDPLESANLYDNPKYARTVANLKQRLASLRKRIGDDGRDFPETEKVVQEFWNYDAADREKARKISNEFLKRRLQTLNAPSKRKKK